MDHLGWAYAQYIVWFIDFGVRQSFWLAVRLHAKASIGQLLAATIPVPPNIQDNVIGQLRNQIGDSPLLASAQLTRAAVMVPNEADHTVNINVSATLWVPDRSDYLGTGTHRFVAQISEAEWRSQVLWSAVVIFVTRRFTFEFFLPFVIGLLPVGAWLYPIVRTWWRSIQ